MYTKHYFSVAHLVAFVSLIALGGLAFWFFLAGYWGGTMELRPVALFGMAGVLFLGVLQSFQNLISIISNG